MQLDTPFSVRQTSAASELQVESSPTMHVSIRTGGTDGLLVNGRRIMFGGVFEMRPLSDRAPPLDPPLILKEVDLIGVPELNRVFPGG